MKTLNYTVLGFKESIFSTMTKLSIEHNAINLSQGFPDFDGPKWIIDFAKKAMDQGHQMGSVGKNQYAPSFGILSLREAISKNYKRFYNLNYDFNNEIIITNGATEAIFCTCKALLNPGDEVVVFEPFYDSYMASVEMAGAKIVPVTLKAPTFSFDINEFQDAFNENTKMVIVNTPHNPTGKVFSKGEIKIIAELAMKFDCYILSDEVYEFLTYEEKHIPVASLKGLRERTITISSTGKTFGLTGWKIGWACGPKEIIRAIHNVHQFTTFSVAHPLQVAMAEALNNMDDYLIDFKNTYRKKRDFLVSGLKKLGFDILTPAGTYFAMAILKDGENDIDFCQKLIVEKKVATIPTSAFYIKSDVGSKMIRFCFAKTDETLINAIHHLS